MKHTIEEAIIDLQRGRPIIVVDNEDRENEGDLVALAERTTPELVNFMITYARGLLCVPMTPERALRLQIYPMVAHNTDTMGTAFTVSVDETTTKTGISAHERSRTVKALASSLSTASQFRRPGHIFPLIAQEGGVLRREGHTEAAVDLARLAGASPVGLICEILNEDGTMSRRPQLEVFAEEHDLKLISIEDLRTYRRKTEALLVREADAKLPTRFGDFHAYVYRDTTDNKEHVALVRGEIAGDSPVLVRLHSECLTGDVFGSLRCDCGPQLEAALMQIAAEGSGILLYLRQEGRGIGLVNKIRAYALQEQGLDTVDANHRLGFPDDLRDYSVGAHILRDLGANEIRLLTNNPGKVEGLKQAGVTVVDRVPLFAEVNPHNEKYMVTKRDRMGHLFHTFLK